MEFGAENTLLHNAVVVFDGEPYAAGDSTSTSTHRGIARWNGSSWVPLGSGLPSGYRVKSLAVYNGELYAGGNFTSIGGVEASRIAAWNGTTWRPVGDGVSFPGSSCEVTALGTHDGHLWVSGRFRYAGNVLSYNFAMTDGHAWFPGPYGPFFADAVAQAITSFESACYFGGWALYWPPNHVGPLLVAGGAGPQFSFVDGFPVFAQINAMATYEDRLIVGGKFAFVPGEVSARNIALFDGTTWSALGPGIDSYARAVAGYKGYIFAGGSFDLGGPTVVSGWARWGPVPCLGDMDCDGFVTYVDADFLLEAFGYPDAEGWPHDCPWLNGDCDQDGDVDFYDIDSFVARLGATCE